ncbi:MAG: hypothetical protein MZV63_36035 [Marinilabiliales bacterium]|nr:hypothetical protein [Marinilabiliales bacterium]
MPDADRILTEEAVAAASGAYAPIRISWLVPQYCLMTAPIVRGANVENAAFPSGSCAEKTALSYTVSNYPAKQIPWRLPLQRCQAGS